MSGEKKRLKKLSCNRIAIIFDGNDRKSNVTLPAFYQQLEKIHRLLTKIEQKKSGGPRVTLYTIADLSHSSPARVEIEARALPEKPDYADAVIQEFDEALYAVYTGKHIAQVDEDILEDLRSIAMPVGKQMQPFTISTSTEDYEITEKIVKRIEAELEVDETEYGAAEGMLEQINIHDGRNFFHIYSEIGLKKLKCRFPGDLMDAATASIGKKVAVSGLMKYRANSNWPFEITVQHMEIFPANSDLPDFDELRGIAPNATADKRSEEYIAELRDGWE